MHIHHSLIAIFYFFSKLYKDFSILFKEMKPGLAILPLEVWADVFEHPMISRQLMAQIADNNGNWNFTNKLQKLLHECGKHSLRYLDISSKPPDETTKEPKIPKSRALLAVSPDGNDWASHLRGELSTYKEFEFPKTEMPENIKTFKQLIIRHLDDKVLGFLDKIKQLFTNVSLTIGSIETANNMIQVLFTHLLPLLASIRRIFCENDHMELLERKFPGTLTQAKELDLLDPEPASIPALLNWLSAPQDFILDGPRLLLALADSKTIFAIVDAVRQQFLSATTSSSAFVIFLEFYQSEEHLRADELAFENATAKEQLTIRNAIFKNPDGDIHFVEIVRHPTGADAKMREWIENRAYFEKEFNGDDEANKVICIDELTIGRITKQAENEPANGNETVGEDDEEVGPSTSRQITKKKKADHGEDEAGPSTPAKKMRND